MKKIQALLLILFSSLNLFSQDFPLIRKPYIESLINEQKQKGNTVFFDNKPTYWLDSNSFIQLVDVSTGVAKQTIYYLNEKKNEEELYSSVKINFTKLLNYYKDDFIKLNDKILGLRHNKKGSVIQFYFDKVENNKMIHTETPFYEYLVGKLNIKQLNAEILNDELILSFTEYSKKERKVVLLFFDKENFNFKLKKEFIVPYIFDKMDPPFVSQKSTTFNNILFFTYFYSIEKTVYLGVIKVINSAQIFHKTKEIETNKFYKFSNFIKRDSTIFVAINYGNEEDYAEAVSTYNINDDIEKIDSFEIPLTTVFNGYYKNSPDEIYQKISTRRFYTESEVINDEKGNFYIFSYKASYLPNALFISYNDILVTKLNSKLQVIYTQLIRKSDKLMPGENFPIYNFQNEGFSFEDYEMEDFFENGKYINGYSKSKFNKKFIKIRIELDQNGQIERTIIEEK